MRALFAFALLAVFALAGTASAQIDGAVPDELQPFDSPFEALPEDGGVPPGSDEAPPAGSDADGLDALFAELKREASTDAAQRIAGRIQAAWLDSGSGTTDLLMGRAREAIAQRDNAAAFDFLDQAIVLDPDYAEAWNRRATLNYQLSRYGRSIADIEQTLAREPRHFGAMMGLGAILEMLDRTEDALAVYLRVLDVYPAMRGAQEAVGRLADEASGLPG